MTSDLLSNTQAEIEPRSGAAERQSSAWDIRNAPKNYFWLVIYQLGSAIFSFGAVWLITRKLGSEGYGGIVAVIAASQVAQVFVNWSSLAVVRFGVDEFIETEKIARVFWTRGIILVINLVLVLVFANVWFPPLAEWLKISPAGSWLVTTHLVVTVFWIHVQMSLQGAKMPRVQGLLQMTERLFIVTGVLTLVAAGRVEFAWIVACYITAPAAMAAVGILYLRRYIFARFAVDRSFVRKIIAYSLPLLPFSLVGYFSGSYVDAVFVSKFLSTRDLGIYSVATQINGIALQFPTLANSLLLPLFISLKNEAEDQPGRNFFGHVLPSFTLLWGVGCTVASFAAYFVIPLVFGEEFRRASLPLWILMTASAISAPAMFGYSAYSHAVSATYVSTFASLGSAATNIGLNYLLIPRFGIAGCAWATLLSFAVSGAIVLILTRRIGHLPFSWIFFAVLPSAFAVGAFGLSESAFVGLGTCLAATFIIGWLFRKSLINAAGVIRSLFGK